MKIATTKDVDLSMPKNKIKEDTILFNKEEVDLNIEDTIKKMGNNIFSSFFDKDENLF